MQATLYLCGSAPSFLVYEVLLMLHQAQVAAAGIKVHVIKKCAVINLIRPPSLFILTMLLFLLPASPCLFSVFHTALKK
jgi:hypothetical protein